MARISIRCPGHPERVEELQGDSVIVGRGRRSGLRIPDNTLSREHCRFERIEASWRLVDLGSQNGTKVNGALLQAPQALLTGDLIQFGRSQLLFVADLPEDLEDDAIEAGQTVCLEALGVDAVEKAPSSAPDRDPPHFVLQYLKAGRRMLLPLGREPLTLGRHKSCGLILQDASVSTCHARIEWQDGVYRIQDLGSTNGVAVNGKKVTAAALAPGTRIRLGHVALGFKEVVKRPGSPPPSGSDDGSDTRPVAAVRNSPAAPCAAPALSASLEDFNEALDKLEIRLDKEGKAP